MKYEYLKGSEKDFEGAPEWAHQVIKSTSMYGYAFVDEFDYMCKYQSKEHSYDVGNISNPALWKVIAKRQPITEPSWDGAGLPPVSYLNSVLNYDEESGYFTWKPRLESDFSTKCQFVSWSNRFAGNKAGTVVSKKKKSYIKINLNGKNYYAHRMAWAIIHGDWPEDEIDHVNGNSLDNSRCNLREVTRKENCRNVSLIPNSTSGYCGVNWHEPSGKWRARVKVDGKENYLGLFDDPQEAAIRIKAIRDSIGFHKNHGQPLSPIRSESDKKRDAAVMAINNTVDASGTLGSEIYDAIAAGKIPGVKLED